MDRADTSGKPRAVGWETVHIFISSTFNDMHGEQCLQTFVGHTGVAFAVAILPDGKCAVSGSEDNTMKLWDLESGRCLQTFVGHSSSVTAVAILPDGKRAISASWDYTLKVWNLESGACIRTLVGHTDFVETVAILPDGKHAVSGSSDRTLKLWNLETGQSPATYQTDSVMFCCDVGSGVIVAGTGTGEILFLKLMPPGRIVLETSAVTWHPSRLLLTAARTNGTLIVQAWHPESQYLEKLARTTIPSITSVQWSTDGTHLLATAGECATRILDAETMHEVSVPPQRWTDRFRRALRLSAPGATPVFDWCPPRDVSPDGRWRAVIEAGQLRIVPATEA